MEALILIIFLIAIGELVVSGTWQKFYFTTGIPMFKKSFYLSHTPGMDEDILNDRFSSRFWGALRFKRMSPYEIAFREAFLSFSLMTYTPVMHGLIRYDKRIRELQVIGFANWFPPLFFIVFIALAWSFPGSESGIPIMIIVFIFVFFMALYFTQVSRFNKVYKALSLEYAELGQEEAQPKN